MAETPGLAIYVAVKCMAKKKQQEQAPEQWPQEKVSGQEQE